MGGKQESCKACRSNQPNPGYRVYLSSMPDTYKIERWSQKACILEAMDTEVKWKPNDVKSERAAHLINHHFIYIYIKKIIRRWRL